MNAKERKELIEKIAKRWRDEGIKALKIYGNFQKYTPLFHFHISEPYDLKENFIYITELFGHINQKPEDAGILNLEGMRRQLQGNYEGLQSIVLQGISEPNILPHETITEAGRKIFRTDPHPTQKLGVIKNEDNILFDHALLYFENATKHLIPQTFHLDLEYATFSNSHRFY
ncbi:hypothetical protein B6U91_01240 [Candidatus Pacearchaeota archaeon ex4484_71]|nr:MAG: hypothetical protein B6U91_01240 [Candidatus Pacearchaeota archaeon ex4484_71]